MRKKGISLIMIIVILLVTILIITTAIFVINSIYNNSNNDINNINSLNQENSNTEDFIFVVDDSFPFSGCKSLEEIHIPKSVNYISKHLLSCVSDNLTIYAPARFICRNICK